MSAGSVPPTQAWALQLTHLGTLWPQDATCDTLRIDELSTGVPQEPHEVVIAPD